MKIREETGVTLTILVITIVIMLIIAGTLAVTLNLNQNFSKLNRLASDLDIIQDKINLYYEENNVLPIGTKVEDDFYNILGENRNVNDGLDYYKIDLSKLTPLNLSFGFGNFDKDYYVVNENSHNVYYYAGIDNNRTTYYGKKEIQKALGNVDFAVDNFEIKTNTDAIIENGKVNIKLEVYTDVINNNISGYKFKINDEEWTEIQTNNKYIYNNLEKNKIYKISMLIIDNNNNEIYASNNELEVIINELPINITFDGKTTGTYNNPIIPAGFMAINQNNAIWESSDGYKNGLVIEDVISKNQFVWIPVDGTKVKLERKDFGAGINMDTCTEDLPTNILNSIKNNGGFYIARYEAGKEGTNTLVSKKNVIPWTGINWNNSKTRAEEMYTESSDYGVISTLMYGIEWDTVLNFLSIYGEEDYVDNSSGLGNYNGTGGNDTTTLTPATTGALDGFMKKNIYDLAGNVREWTMEKYNSGYIARGGMYSVTGTAEPVSHRNNQNTTDNLSYLGFRVALYIK